jgi:DNA repair exonuclease SbcCD ATPase subunit
VDETADSLARFSEKTEATKEDLDELDAIIAKLKPDRSYCEIPVSIALFQCPLLQRQRLSSEEQPPEDLVVADLGRARKAEIETQLEGLKRNLEHLALNLNDCQQREATARKARDEIRKRQSELAAQLAQLGSEAVAWSLRAEDAELSHKQLGETRNILIQIESDLDSRKALQDEAQKEARDRQIDIEEIFMALCRYFKGDNAEGELKFTRDEIRARIGSGGGAYNALSSITFDFAALLAHMNGVGHHPGFHIHDSPRESDMEASLYRPVFRLIRELETAVPNSFQYIITTTASPPEDFTKAPHLILELDGSKPEGHLFKLAF